MIVQAPNWSASWQSTSAWNHSCLKITTTSFSTNTLSNQLLLNRPLYPPANSIRSITCSHILKVDAKQRAASQHSPTPGSIKCKRTWSLNQTVFTRLLQAQCSLDHQGTCREPIHSVKLAWVKKSNCKIWCRLKTLLRSSPLQLNNTLAPNLAKIQ